MRVKDTHEVSWTVHRRTTPWQRLIQPANLAVFDYSRYRVAPARENVFDRSKRRRAARQERQEAKQRKREVHGWQWLYLAPLLIVAVLVVGFAGQVVEAVVYLGVLLLWAVLMPFYLAELLVRTLLGAGLWLARLTGLARTRVDLVGQAGGIKSLTKVLVPGWGNAGHLVQALADQRRTAATPFDPRDPAVWALLGGARAEVVEHASVWANPVTVLPGR